MISDLRHKVTIEKKALTPDGGGGFTEGWTPIEENADTFISLMAAGGSEKMVDRQTIPVLLYRIKMRYRSDVAFGMRLRAVTGECYYTLIVQDPDGRKGFLDILAEKR